VTRPKYNYLKLLTLHPDNAEVRKKIYGKPMTPYQRLMDSKHVSKYRKHLLQKRYEQLDPFVLAEGLKKKVHQFTEALRRVKMGGDHG